MCRTEIQCWTTKKIVQQTLDEQKRREEISPDELRHEEVSEVEIRQEEVTQDAERENEVDGFKYCELSRFNSFDNFLNCLTCLYHVKAELSYFEILLILRSNLAIGRCS